MRGRSRWSARRRPRRHLPDPPVAGVVCRCMGTTVDDLEAAWDAGFTELELLKRAALAWLGPCQGGACLPHVRSWIASPLGHGPRPVHRPPRRAPDHARRGRGGRHDRRLPADAAPRRAPRAGRADGPVRRLVAAVALRRRGRRVLGRPRGVSRSATSARSASSSCPGRTSSRRSSGSTRATSPTSSPGRSRYALLLNERGHVIDDGMIVREADDRFVLTFTSGGAANAEMWVRDWIDTWGLRVHVLDRTMSLAAINVTGPLAATLLAASRAGRPAALPRPRARRRRPACPCHVMRLSFTGEASFELHHPVDRVGRAVAGTDASWAATSASGPTGSRRCSALRLEKGHVIVGMDTELDSTPRRLGMDWAVQDGQAVLHRQAGAGAHRPLPDERRLARLHDGRAGRRSKGRRSSSAATSSAT